MIEVYGLKFRYGTDGFVLNVLDNIVVPFRINRALRLTDEVRSRAEDLRDNGDSPHYPSKISHGNIVECYVNARQGRNREIRGDIRVDQEEIYAF